MIQFLLDKGAKLNESGKNNTGLQGGVLTTMSQSSHPGRRSEHFVAFQPDRPKLFASYPLSRNRLVEKSG